MNQFKTPLQQVVQYDKYAKWIPEENRRETWEETVRRVIVFFNRQMTKRGKYITSIPWVELEQAMLNLDVMPSMRIVQMAGPALERCNVGGYNCAYTTLRGPSDLAELLYILMQGTGCGYSVENEYISQWPRVMPWQNVAYMYRVEDTTEGWCEAFRLTIEHTLKGEGIGWIYDDVRPEGAWLHTKGGRASGPEPLKQLLNSTRNIIESRQGSFLSSFDIHRLACMAGQIVQVGGVRRSALIALFDASDMEMAHCKDGEFWHEFPELSQANNSAVYAADMPFPEGAWRKLSGAKTGEPGIFRRPSTLANRKVSNWGMNPCGEIILRPQQFCNLSQAIARPTDTVEDLERKVRLASIFGTIQSMLTDFNYLRPEWKANCEDEHLLGVDITGVQDCSLLQITNEDLPALLMHLKDLAERTNREYASKLTILASTSVTCNKPSGNSSQLLDCSSGIHPRFAPFYLRRIRLGARSPLAEYLRGVGVPLVPESGHGTLDQARVWVAEFPVASPRSAITKDGVTAEQQFHTWLVWKLYWTSHNPSCTIYVANDEWERLGTLVKDWWGRIGGLSFLPKDDHIYPLAPYEEISEEQFYQLNALIPPLDLTSVKEKVDTTTMAQDYACEGDKCLWEPKQ